MFIKSGVNLLISEITCRFKYAVQLTGQVWEENCQSGLLSWGSCKAWFVIRLCDRVSPCNGRGLMFIYLSSIGLTRFGIPTPRPPACGITDKGFCVYVGQACPSILWQIEMAKERVIWNLHRVLRPADRPPGGWKLVVPALSQRLKFIWEWVLCVKGERTYETRGDCLLGDLLVWHTINAMWSSVTLDSVNSFVFGKIRK